MDKQTKRAVILGGGESGVGAARLCQKQNYNVFLSDAGKLKAEYRDTLQSYAIPFEEGQHSYDKILNADLIIKSPGIPESADIIKTIRAKGIKIISEIELAGWYSNGKMICITGSNGKTTTTSLIYHILKLAGYDVGLGGNIGESLAMQVAENDRSWYVVELSSFQLEGMYDFKASIAILLNITPDHMDRYDHKLENYAAAKWRIFQNMQASDTGIYWCEDTLVVKGIQAAGDFKKLGFADHQRSEAVAYTQNDCLIVDGNSYSLSKVQLKGEHNRYNMLASILAAQTAGVPTSVIQEGLESFAGVEHRLEFIRTLDGVDYYNDSKATNVDSVHYALNSFTRPIVWIAGGTDKGNDYSTLLPLVEGRVHTLICLGVDNRKLKTDFAKTIPVILETQSVQECVQMAREHAHSGDIVLLSPACASFDLFQNYEDRGKQFKSAVSEL